MVMNLSLSNSIPSVKAYCACSRVSGTSKPLAFEMSWNTPADSAPRDMRTIAATIEERPIPTRQCIATWSPRNTEFLSRSTSSKTSDRLVGIPRSGIGKDMKSIPPRKDSDCSASRSSSITSGDSRSDTTRPTPAVSQACTSPSSQSPPRG